METIQKISPAAGLTYPPSGGMGPGISKPKSAVQPPAAESDSPAAQTDHWSFITSLSINKHFVALTTILAGLPKSGPPSSAKKSPIPKWAAWSWGFGYLPEDIHSQGDVFRTAVVQLKDACWNSATRGTPVVLGFSLLLQECRHTQDYEEDDENSEITAPPYLANSQLGIARMEEVLTAIEAVVAWRKKVEEGSSREMDITGEKMMNDKEGLESEMQMSEGEKMSGEVEDIEKTWRSEMKDAEKKRFEEKKKDDKKTDLEMKKVKMTIEVPRMLMKTVLKRRAEDPVTSELTEGTTEEQKDGPPNEYQQPGPSKTLKKDSPAKNTQSKRIRVLTKWAQGQV
ncbi:hypothetical protein PAXRUDRAFT_20982 [Paxillus rubicundulus Ve08.2h10]|uniref:Uncharacterized protein n=1 Tax=Paxillus rubicundulus Ve08.2h10 TaxID=930991 RepID=A0A0D0CR94_9AGAM|nr:hypothetical protein PAXRUDRAFT_20982 [Paxillus rubicundulus Ve08.2h10]